VLEPEFVVYVEDVPVSIFTPRGHWAPSRHEGIGFGLVFFYYLGLYMRGIRKCGLEERGGASGLMSKSKNIFLLFLG
jgi:hypothetical protein